MIDKMKRTKRELMYKGSILDIYKDTMEFSNGHVEYWDTVSHRMGAAAILPVLPDEELELFAQGINYNIYKILGAHKKKIGSVEGVEFAVWAPNAQKVSVVGDFNLWDGRRHLMEMQKDSGIFALFTERWHHGILALLI